MRQHEHLQRQEREEVDEERPLYESEQRPQAETYESEQRPHAEARPLPANLEDSK